MTREQLNEYYRRWRLRNPGKNTEYHMRWRAKNRDRYLKYQRAYQWSLPKNNHMRLGRLLRCRINAALNGNLRAESLAGLLGCSLFEFRRHIESQFKEGMKWDNHGDYWHIDHIKPCASFDLTTAEGQKACFHFSNQQPMLATKNLQKSDCGRRRKST